MKKFILIFGCIALFMSIAGHAYSQGTGDSINAGEQVLTNDSVAKESKPTDENPWNNWDIIMSKDNNETIVEVIAILGVFLLLPLMVIALVLISNYNRRKREKRKYDLMEKAIDSGKELPVDFFKENKPPKNHLQKGIINIAIGLGAFLFLFFVADKAVSTLAGIPFFIGLGQIIIHFMDEKKKVNEKDEINS